MSTPIPHDADGKIIDLLDPRARLDPRPDELRRQRALRRLHLEYGYPRAVMAREVALDDPRDTFYIVVYSSAAACKRRDRARIRLVVASDGADLEESQERLAAAILRARADGGLWFGGADDDDALAVFHRRGDAVVPWIGLPRPSESWDALGPRTRDQLVRPSDVRALLRRCHNRLHARGAASDEEDLTLDIIRLLIAKAIDEGGAGERPDFVCAPAEYLSEAGRAAAAARVRGLFEAAKRRHPGVFREDERITVDDRAIVDVVGELQPFRLLGDPLDGDADDADADAGDLIGAAYEEYTELSLKRRRGQFFTNRRVVDLLVGLVEPGPDDTVLDPAGGSAGFLTGALRSVRRRIAAAEPDRERARARARAFRRRLFMVEISRRLVKVAKAAMILHGDDHGGMTQGDALGPAERLDPALLAACGPGAADVILTNPPFAGAGEGRILDPRVLARFETGRRWIEQGGAYAASDEPLAEGAPPEMLFVERCVTWLAPGGRLGVVVPKSFLDTNTYRPARALLLRECRLLAVVTCHKHTFQPHTGVRTALVVVEKRRPGEALGAGDPPIFMAISRAVGQDSEGAPVFARDPTGGLTERVDEDLTAIAADWRRHREGALVASEYRFAIARAGLDGGLNINPQAHRPSLNATIEAIEALDDSPAWSVCSLGQLCPGVEVFKGPRLRSEDLLVEADLERDAEADAAAGVEPYYTPSAVLQGRRDAAKRLSTARATPAQAQVIAAIRVRRGDLVITRSGNIGRVAIITSLFDGAIVSDDLIRVRVPDERLRLFLWAYLESKGAQDQIMRNEYGAIQQHLEPEHVRAILVPLPADQARVDAIVGARRAMLRARESLLRAEAASDDQVDALLGFLGASSG